MREQKSAEDRAVFDAYQNGGLYKGQKVTDSFILKYIENRRNGFDTQDPLYDEWNNRLIQTKFSIGEQKIGLAFKQGKVGAGAVAAFYRKQLKDIPKDSAFYRDVAGRAADWAKSAVGAARGRARGRATSGLRKQLNQALLDQQGYLQLEAALTEYARREGIISGTQELSEADATALTEMFERGITANGKAITLVSFRSAAKLHFKALGKEVQLQIALGNQGITARNKRQKFLNETLLGLNAVDDRAKYELARESLIESLNAAGDDPYAAADAYKAYAEQLKTIHAQAVKAGGDNTNSGDFLGGLVNEFNLVTTGKGTGKTVADLWDMDDLLGNSAQQGESIVRMQNDINLLETGQAYYGQSEPGGPLKVTLWPTGAGTNPLGLDDSLQPSIAKVEGQTRIAYLKGAAVTASVIIDANGDAVDPALLSAEALRAGLNDGSLTIEQGGILGYEYTNPITKDRKYGVRDLVTGVMLFTDENPWTTDPLNTGNGLTVFGTSLVKRGDRMVPDLTNLLRGPLNINTANPFLSDATLSPKDLQMLAASGALNLPDDQLAQYRARLEREQKSRTLTMESRDRGYESGEQPGIAIAGAMMGGSVGGIADAIRQGIDAIRQANQSLMLPNVGINNAPLGSPPSLTVGAAAGAGAAALVKPPTIAPIAAAIGAGASAIVKPTPPTAPIGAAIGAGAALIPKPPKPIVIDTKPITGHPTGTGPLV